MFACMVDFSIAMYRTWYMYVCEDIQRTNEWISVQQFTSS